MEKERIPNRRFSNVSYNYRDAALAKTVERASNLAKLGDFLGQQGIRKASGIFF
jgi:hypothetical protein